MPKPISESTREAINKLQLLSETARKTQSYLKFSSAILSVGIMLAAFLFLRDPAAGFQSLSFVQTLLASCFIGVIPGMTLSVLTIIGFACVGDEPLLNMYRFMGLLSTNALLKQINNQPSTEISCYEVTQLMGSYQQFIQHDFDPADFLRYLKLNIKLDELKTVVNLGSTPIDCSLDTFEKVDAQQVTSLPDGIISLQWLAAKAINQHNLPLNTLSKKAQEIVKQSKKFAK